MFVYVVLTTTAGETTTTTTLGTTTQPTSTARATITTHLTKTEPIVTQSEDYFAETQKMMEKTPSPSTTRAAATRLNKKKGKSFFRNIGLSDQSGPAIIAIIGGVVIVMAAIAGASIFVLKAVQKRKAEKKGKMKAYPLAVWVVVITMVFILVITCMMIFFWLLIPEQKSLASLGNRSR